MPRKQYQYHYIYRTTNILNNKFYIGMHSTNDLNDGYQGSGKRLWRSINKHGKENHKTEILEYLPDRESLRIREREIVDRDLINEELCMNLVIGGSGSWEHANDPNYNNPTHTKEHMDKMRKKALEVWDDPVRSQKLKENMSVSMKKAYKNGTRISCIVPFIKGEFKHSEKTKQNMSKNRKGKSIGEDNSQYGTKWSWVNKNGDVLKVKYEDCEKYLIDGWIKGITPPTKKKCKKCGEVNCQRPEICKKTRIISFLINFLGFDDKVFGTINYYKEYDRIVKMLHDRYYIDNKSIRDIGREFNVIPPHKIHNAFKALGINCRSQEKALRNYYDTFIKT